MSDTADTSPRSSSSDDDEQEEKPNLSNTVEDLDVSLLLDIKKLNLSSKHRESNKKLLIFNINGLLLHRTHVKDTLKTPKNRRPDAVFGSKLVFKRPFAKELIAFCLEKFEVAIWSSVMEHNVDPIMDFAFGKLSSRLLFIWTQEHCSDYGFMSLENDDKPLFFKELKKVWGNSHKNYEIGSFSATNTLLIDDKPYKGLLNPNDSGIYPYPYFGEDKNDNALDPKGELGLYLAGLAEAEDVPSYVAANPFGNPAIKEGHPQWSFYSDVLARINGN